jgi:hypothetical protein
MIKCCKYTHQQWRSLSQCNRLFLMNTARRACYFCRRLCCDAFLLPSCARCEEEMIAQTTCVLCRRFKVTAGRFCSMCRRTEEAIAYKMEQTYDDLPVGDYCRQGVWCAMPCLRVWLLR